MARSLPVESSAKARGGDRHADALGEHAQQVALALGELDRLLVVLQLAARHVEHVVAHADLFARAGGARRAAQDVAQAQQQFARLEGLGQVVVDAGFETFDAVLGLGACGQHADGNASASP